MKKAEALLKVWRQVSCPQTRKKTTITTKKHTGTVEITEQFRIKCGMLFLEDNIFFFSFFKKPCSWLLAVLLQHTMGKDKEALPSKYSPELEDLVSSLGLSSTLSYPSTNDLIFLRFSFLCGGHNCSLLYGITMSINNMFVI